MNWSFCILVALASLLFLHGAEAADITISLGPTSFFPPLIEGANVGDRVVWTWTTGINHTVTEGNPGSTCTGPLNPKFDSGVKSNLGDTFSYVITTSDVGTLTYFCRIHCQAGMIGTILVRAQTPPPPTPSPSSCLLNNIDCVGKGSSCALLPPTELASNWKVCGGAGRTCVLGVCQDSPTDQQVCSRNSGLTCYDKYFDLTCLTGNVCGARNIAGPGEQCFNSGNDAKFYENGGCFGQGVVCQSPALGGKSICFPWLPVGAACNVGAMGAVDYCGPGLFCDRSSGIENSTCRQRQDVGANCTSDTACRIDLHCRQSDNTCQAYFSAASGASCSGPLDCQEGLFCNSRGVCVPIPQGEGTVCTVRNNFNDSACPEGLQCQCSSRTNDPSKSPDLVCKPSCVPSGNDINNVQRLLACAARNNCQGTLNLAALQSTRLNYYRGSCLERNCASDFRSATDSIRRCLLANNPAPCSSATGLTVTISLLLASVLVPLLFSV